MAFKPYVIVEAGTVGVVTHFGAVQDDILSEGLYIVMPVKTKVEINVRIQKIEAEASASSKDLQVVTSKVAINFKLDKSKAATIFQSLGLDYQSTIIAPSVQESIKSTTSQFTAEELITRRSEVKVAVFEDVKRRLKEHNIIVTDFSILDFNFSSEFNRAIEEKQVAEQKALRANNDLKRIQIESDQAQAKSVGQAQAKLELAKADAQAVLELAKAEVESQRLIRETLTPEIIKLRAIEKWDGVLPSVMLQGNGSDMIFDVSKFVPKK